MRNFARVAKDLDMLHQVGRLEHGDEVLILELAAVDGLATGAVVVSEVTTLSHEASDDSVEGASLEVKAVSFLTGAESAEVFGGLGGVTSESHGDSAGSLTANGDVEEDSGVNCVSHLEVSEKSIYD